MNRQQGFSSILLIAIIVLLAGMTTFALRFVAGAEGNASALSQTLKAQQAAEAGMEWLRYRLRAGQCQATRNVTIPMSTGNVQATVTCVRAPAVMHTEGVGPGVVNSFSYTLVSTACWPDAAGSCPNPVLSANYVARVVRGGATCTTAIPAVCTW